MMRVDQRALVTLGLDPGLEALGVAPAAELLGPLLAVERAVTDEVCRLPGGQLLPHDRRHSGGGYDLIRVHGRCTGGPIWGDRAQ